MLSSVVRDGLCHWHCIGDRSYRGDISPLILRGLLGRPSPCVPFRCSRRGRSEFQYLVAVSLSEIDVVVKNDSFVACRRKKSATPVHKCGLRAKYGPKITMSPGLCRGRRKSPFRPEHPDRTVNRHCCLRRERRVTEAAQ